MISVGAPWRGSVSAQRISSLFSWTGRNLTPALSDMAEGSPFLTALHADVPSIADRVTNIYSTHELFIQPYINAHMDVPGVKNVLIATDDEYRRHLRAFPELEVDDQILGTGHAPGRDEFTGGPLADLGEGRGGVRAVRRGE